MYLSDLSALLDRRAFHNFAENLNAENIAAIDPTLIQRATRLMLEGKIEPDTICPSIHPLSQMLKIISPHAQLLEAVKETARQAVFMLLIVKNKNAVSPYVQEFASAYKTMCAYPALVDIFEPTKMDIAVHVLLQQGSALAFQRVCEGAKNHPAQMRVIETACQSAVRAMVANKKAAYLPDLVAALPQNPSLIEPAIQGMREGVGDVLGQPMVQEKLNFTLEAAVEYAAFAMLVAQRATAIEACGKISGVKTNQIEQDLSTRFARAGLVRDRDVWAVLLPNKQPKHTQPASLPYKP